MSFVSRHLRFRWLWAKPELQDLPASMTTPPNISKCGRDAIEENGTFDYGFIYMKEKVTVQLKV